VYLDLSLSSIAPDGFYREGSVVREQLGGILLEAQNCTGVDCPPLAFAFRSEPGEVTNTGVMCETTYLMEGFYISGNNSCIIETGNIACNTDDITDRFDGENKFFKMYVAICDTDFYSYICQVDSNGVITVIGGVCPPPI
jgi:hypothetical protein